MLWDVTVSRAEAVNKNDEKINDIQRIYSFLHDPWVHASAAGLVGNIHHRLVWTFALLDQQRNGSGDGKCMYISYSQNHGIPNS